MSVGMAAGGGWSQDTAITEQIRCPSSQQAGRPATQTGVVAEELVDGAAGPVC
jgi:hypothetical protein